MSEEQLSPAQRYAAFQASQKQRKSLTGLFSQSLSFDIDDFQRDACQALENNQNVLVAAPTGAGKTVVADFAIFLAQQRNVKAFYTTPIKALSNQKFHELAAAYGEDRVGLLTGDVSINSEADIVVMTTEVLRNMLYEKSSTLNALGYVVLDEIHYLADRMRGQVWEEVIIHLPDTVKIIGLSATVSNIEDFTAWIRSVRGDTALIMSETRPVPLLQHVLLQESARKEPQVFDLYQSPQSTKINRSLVQALANLDDQARREAASRNRKSFGLDNHGRKRSRALPAPIRHYTPKRWAVVDELDFLDMLPGIYFIFSRTGCDKAVQQCLQAGLELTTPQEVHRIRSIVNEMIDGQLSADEKKALHFHHFLAALELGFAAHHAGMITLFRHVVEALFEQGLIKVVFATETLALGINMPARSVIVEKLVKFNGVGHVNLTPGEFTQLTGRAGRRGIDTIGHAVVVDHRDFVPAAAANLASKRVYPLHSSFTPTFNMAVNLLHTHTLEQSRATLDHSFAQWEANASADSLVATLEETRSIVGSYSEAMHCDMGDFEDFMRIRMKISDIEKHDRRILKSTVFRSESQRKKAFAQLDKKLAVLKNKEKTHSCKNCPDFSDHVRWGHRWARQTRELERLENRVASRTQSVSRHFDRICSVLTHLDYLREGSRGELELTQRGDLLRHVYSENDLLLAQCIDEGIFNNLDAQECAALMTAFVYESRYGSTREPSHYPGGAKGVLATTVNRIKVIDKELQFMCESFDLDTNADIDFGLVEVMFDWVSEKPLTDVLRNAPDLTAGDFVRSCNRTCDVLTQLAHIGTILGNDNLSRVANEAYDVINHGIVALNPI